MLQWISFRQSLILFTALWQVAALLTACQSAAPPFECTDKIGCVTIGPDEPIKIAVLQTLSGDVAAYGMDQVRGIELAVADRDGKLLGHPIELQKEDDQCSSEGGATAGLKIVAARMMYLSRGEAEGFYAVHRERPFFRDLVEFMTSGPVMIQVLEGENAIQKNRDLMGATDPRKAAPGTIRADFAQSIDANAVHGSDSPQTAATEIGYFFPALDIFSR